MNLNQLIQSGLYEQAIKECKALISDADLDDDKQAKLTGLVYLGIIYTKQRLYHKSKDVFDTHFNDIVDDCKYYWNGKELADTYFFYKENDKVETYIDAYLEQNPDDEKALIIKANVLYHWEKYQDALNTFNNALKINPENVQALYSAGLCNTQLNNEQKAFQCFEQAFDLGLDKAIIEILKILFIRTGHCDYKNCKDCCCKGVLLKGSDGQTINNDKSFELLLTHDARNSCWLKDKVNNKEEWIFECKNLGENNHCINYDMRPDTCRDYPASILTTREACSYIFKLKDKIPAFCSQKNLKVVLHILKASGFTDAFETLLNHHKSEFDQI